MKKTEVPFVFADREAAEAAIDDLASCALCDDKLWRAVHSCDHRAVDDDADRTVFGSVVGGVAIGTPIGAIAGALLLYLGQLVAGLDVHVAGTLLAGAFGGFMAGVFFGIVAGIARQSSTLYQRDRWSDVDLAPNEYLVVARGGRDEDEIRDVLRRHGGRELEAA